ncbi:uncharacterized protein TNCV_2853071 [Trichonephila clavipes]|uniref:Uncharacterized protein n=1 Tax=Trichonephila clavipes TaxID=2585209 RepID=A0A8X6RGD9_TRICX|nr:uncharacterized protein TNCV_2853071 [Trichonephila clavipes]
MKGHHTAPTNLTELWTALANISQVIFVERFQKLVESISRCVTAVIKARGGPTRYYEATRGLLATDHVILNHGQVTWTTPELAPPLLTTTPHQREDVSALDRFNVHRCPTRRVFSGTGLEPVQGGSQQLE